MSVNYYLTRRYDARTYNCAHLVCEVFGDLHGPEMEAMLRGFLCAPRERRALVSDLRKIRFLDKPEDSCVVLMQSPSQAPHVGIWLRGRVLHILKDHGVQFQPLEVVSLGFKRVRYFTCSR